MPLAENCAHATHVLRRLLERDRRRKASADPEVALLELRHELAAECTEEHEADEDGQETDRERGPWTAHAEEENRRIEAAEHARREAVFVAGNRGDGARRERGREREGEDDRTADRERVRVRHRREDDAGDAR